MIGPQDNTIDETEENDHQKVYKYQHPFLLSWYERLAASGKDSHEEPKEIENTEMADQNLLEEDEGLPLYFRRGKKMLPLQRIGKREEENELYPMRFRRKFTHPMASYLQKKNGDDGEISMSELKKIAGSNNWWFSPVVEKSKIKNWRKY